jgi:hypothetical protein
MATTEVGAPAQKRFGSTLFWRLFALINLFTIGWVGWVIWQLTPHPVVHDFVLRLPVAQRTASGTIAARAALANVAPVTSVTPVAPPGPVAEIPIQSGPPMSPLRMETEIKTPPKK